MESTGRQFIAVIDEWDAPIRDKSATDSLLHYIGMDYSGMSDAVRDLLAEKSVGVNIRMFQNDITEFQGLDDVLTLLIHFGYLSYNQENETARIPNEEIRMEFEDCIRHVTLPETVRRVRESDELIRATIAVNEEAVARQLEKIHEEESSPLFYNNEQTCKHSCRIELHGDTD